MSTKSILNWPGHISAQLHDGAWPGVKATYFMTTWGFNRFFREHDGKPGHGRLVVKAEAKPWLFGLVVGWVVLYTNQQSPEDMEDMEIVAREVEAKLSVIRRKRAAMRAELAAVEVAAKAEMARLANIGKKYEDRVSHLRSLPASDKVRKSMQTSLDSGDFEVLFASKEDAFKAGYVQGHATAAAKDEGLVAAVKEAE